MLNFFPLAPYTIFNFLQHAYNAILVRKKEHEVRKAKRKSGKNRECRFFTVECVGGKKKGQKYPK